MKIYQDAVRPDLFSKLKGLDTREKLGFLQLQALVGMTKFDSVDKKRFPMVFSKRGILAKQGYEILQDENGVLTINYTPKKEKADKKIKRESTLRERIRVETSLEEQKDFVQKFMERSKQIRSEDKEKGR